MTAFAHTTKRVSNLHSVKPVYYIDGKRVSAKTYNQCLEAAYYKGEQTFNVKGTRSCWTQIVHTRQRFDA